MTVHQVCVCNRTPCPNNIQILPNQSLPQIAVQFNNSPLTVLIDTGAQVPLIDELYCKSFSSNESSSQVKFSTKTVQAVGCDGTQLQITGTITGKFQFHQYDDPPLFAEFYILKKCSQQCIFPFTWLKALKVTICHHLTQYFVVAMWTSDRRRMATCSWRQFVPRKTSWTRVLVRNGKRTPSSLRWCWLHA